MSKIDRFGKCPNCEEDWTGEDVHTELNGLSVFTHKTPNEMENLASNFGWSKDNPSKFSKVIVIDIEAEKELYKCPNIRCSHLFDPETGIEWESIENYREDIEFTKEKTEDEIKGEIIANSDSITTKYLMTPEEIKEKFGKNIVVLDTEPKEIDGGEIEDLDEFRKFFKK